MKGKKRKHTLESGEGPGASGLRRDVSGIKGDVSTLKKDLSESKGAISSLIEGQNSIFEILARMDRKMDALGSRWGLHAEAAFREAMREILEGRGIRVEVWKMRDTGGTVFGRAADIEIDLLMTNGRHTLVEIKSSLSDGDVAKLIRIGKLYEATTGETPELAAICPFITDAAYRLAKESGLKIYTDPSRVHSR